MLSYWGVKLLFQNGFSNVKTAQVSYVSSWDNLRKSCLHTEGAALWFPSFHLCLGRGGDRQETGEEMAGDKGIQSPQMLNSWE